MTDPNPTESKDKMRDGHDTTPLSQQTRPFQDWVALKEYEIAENAEKRLWGSLKSKFWVIGIALATLGYVGPRLILNYVTDNISAKLQQDTSTLRKQVEEQLSEMTVQTAQLKSQAETAQTELAKLHDYAQAFDKLAPQYAALKAQVDQDGAKVDALEKEVQQKLAETSQSSGRLGKLTSQIDDMTSQVASLKSGLANAQQTAFGSQLGVTNLGSVLPLSTLSGPLITGTSSAFISEDMSLTGVNFGQTTGKVYLLPPISTGVLQVFGNPPPGAIELEVASWGDAKITLQVSPETVAKVKAQGPDIQTALTLGQPGNSLTSIFNSTSASFRLMVQTAAGQSSNWWLIGGQVLTGNN